ncbi:MAG: GspE/PulE family protein, partial [Planctomycetota bacterium]
MELLAPAHCELAPPSAEEADPPHDPLVYERISPEFARLIPIDFARDHLVVSQGIQEGGIEVLIVGYPEHAAAVSHNVSVRLGRPIRTRIGDRAEIAALLDRLAEQVVATTEGDGISAASEFEESFGDADLDAIARADERDLLATTGRGPIVKLTNSILFAALQQRASDIHLQQIDDETVVRFRIDGVLYEQRRLPPKLHAPIVSRVKVMCGLDIAERRLPQDGRATVRVGEREVDLRVSTLPTQRGERLVVRLLDKGMRESFDLDVLGMPPDVREPFEKLCSRSHGMMLVTGPTGSGKTTTLYSALLILNTPDRNIMTIEDPIEYELPGISQSQINTRKGVTFATGLRHILRQDPDVIMVGEIRDAETARIAIQSALTGHLVFSTLHTNDAPSAVTRLSDLGVEPYLINASLSAVLAQRLVRTICEECRGDGCSSCHGTGLRGRRGLFELLHVDKEMTCLISEGASTERLKDAARSNGMRTLRERGLELVLIHCERTDAGSVKRFSGMKRA